MHADQLAAKRSHITMLPYELLEQIAYCIELGRDLINWIEDMSMTATMLLTIYWLKASG
jgi:hypothetical protein